MAALDSLGDMFGFGGWNLGLGSIGNFVIWFIAIFFIVGMVGGFIIWRFFRNQYKYKIEVWGMVGNFSGIKWVDKAKKVRMGRVGDNLFFLLKNKKYIPPPELQAGVNKYLFWEREDGELINIKPTNLDEKMREIGVKFIHSDMRMQRLGIEKNLQFRLQKESFWEKYGNQIMNVIFYVLMMVILIVLFTQVGKLGDKLGSIALQLDDRIQAYHKIPEPIDESGTSGTIPAVIIPLLLGRFKWLKL